jgi:hypothetical protein
MPALRIRDILVRKRLRIRGFVPLTDSESDPVPDPDPAQFAAIFVIDLQDGN